MAVTSTNTNAWENANTTLAANIFSSTTAIVVDTSTVAQHEDFRHFERAVKFVIPVVFGLITILGLCGNSLVIYIIAFDRKLRTPTYILILNLAVADILFIAICVPFTASIYVLPRWIFGRVWCKTYQYFIYVSAFVSVYTLVLMSFARCIAVVQPLSAKFILNIRNTCVAIWVLWVVILSGFTPLLIDFDVYEYEYQGEERATCINLKNFYHDNVRKLFYGNFFVFGYILPLCLMIILYSVLLASLKCRKDNIETLSKGRSRANNRATRMVIAVVLAFLLLWLPIQVSFMIQNFGRRYYSTTELSFQMVGNCLAYFSSCINPILYTFVSKQFRSVVVNILCCRRKE